jgi:hypothetical protein
MKKIESIDSSDSLIRVLRRYFGLNGKLDLTPEQKFRKQEYEDIILTFLNDLETASRFKDANNPDYSLKLIKKFFESSAIPWMSKEQEAEFLDLFYVRIQHLMKERNLKSKDIVEATGINQSVFSKIYNGDRKPSKAVRQRLSEYFNEDFSKYH